MNAAEAVAAVDLEYSLAIDEGGTSVEGVYVYFVPLDARVSPGHARIVVENEDSSAVYFLTAAECVRLGQYLLACAKAAS